MLTVTMRPSIAVLAALSALARAASADAATTPAQSASGDFTSMPFHVVLNAQRAAGAPETSATGFFSSTSMAGSNAVMSVSGPVKCLSIVGDRLGLFYPVTSSSPAAFAQANGGVFIYIQQASGGLPARVSFVPVPQNTTTSCDPLTAVFPIQSGTLTLNGGGSQSGTTSPAARHRPKKHAHRRPKRRAHHPARRTRPRLTG